MGYNAKLYFITLTNHTIIILADTLINRYA